MLCKQISKQHLNPWSSHFGIDDRCVFFNHENEFNCVLYLLRLNFYPADGEALDAFAIPNRKSESIKKKKIVQMNYLDHILVFILWQ